jgi:hypothetical protein
MALCSAEDAGLRSRTYLTDLLFMQTIMQVAAVMAGVSACQWVSHPAHAAVLVCAAVHTMFE